MQVAAARITEAQAGEAAVMEEVERRDEEAADLRRRAAELEGALSVQGDLEVRLPHYLLHRPLQRIN